MNQQGLIVSECIDLASAEVSFTRLGKGEIPPVKALPFPEEVRRGVSAAVLPLPNAQIAAGYYLSVSTSFTG